MILRVSRLLFSFFGVVLGVLPIVTISSGFQTQTISSDAPAGLGNEGRLVVLTKTDFQDGIIELDLAGEPGPNAGEGARGFVGVAFRVAPDQIAVRVYLPAA